MLHGRIGIKGWVLLSQCIDGRVDPGESLLGGSKQAEFPIQTYLMSDQPVIPHTRCFRPKRMILPSLLIQLLPDCFHLLLLFGNRLADCFDRFLRQLFLFLKYAFVQFFPRAGRCDFCVDLILMRQILFYCLNFFRQHIVAFLQSNINARAAFLHLDGKPLQTVVELNVKNE